MYGTKGKMTKRRLHNENKNIFSRDSEFVFTVYGPDIGDLVKADVEVTALFVFFLSSFIIPSVYNNTNNPIYNNLPHPAWRYRGTTVMVSGASLSGVQRQKLVILLRKVT